MRLHHLLGRILRWTGVSLSLCGSLSALGATASWRNEPFEIVARDMKVADLLREVLASQGLAAGVDNAVDGVVSGRFTGPATSVLDRLCRSYGLTWYYDGAIVYIEPAASGTSQVLNIPSGSARRARELLDSLRIADGRFPLVVNEAEDTVFVSGPTRYVQAVSQALRNLQARLPDSDESEIWVFQLHYAWAQDMRVKQAGHELVIPGVASVLRRLFARQDPNGMGPSAIVAPAGERTATRKTRLHAEEGGDDKTPARPPEALAPRSRDYPRFEADPRSNAVLVRDLPGQQAKYKNLIETLDVRPRMVEIEVSIMDISSDSLDTLGVDWRVHGSKADVQFSSTTSPSVPQAGQAVGGLVVSLGNELRDQLLARVRALASKGSAYFVARPKVVTLNNTEAMLDNLDEFFVRVGGFQDAGLFNVVSGNSLRITPMIVDGAATATMLLSMQIGDDSLSDRTVDSIPAVQRRAISTQAMVEDGKSLLIAGFQVTETTSGKAGIPGLRDLPVVGGLFRYSDASHREMQRFYLLTPRLSVGVPREHDATEPQ